MRTLRTRLLRTPRVKRGAGSGVASYLWNLVGTANPSAVADVDLDLFDDTYRVYALLIDQLAPVNDGVGLRAQVRIAGVDQAGATSYSYGVGQLFNSAWGFLYSAGNSFAWTLSTASGNAAGEGASVRAMFFRPHDAENGFFGWTLEGIATTQSGFSDLSIAANQFNTEGANISGFRIYFATGNIASGRIRLYGLVGS